MSHLGPWVYKDDVIRNKQCWNKFSWIDVSTNQMLTRLSVFSGCVTAGRLPLVDYPWSTFHTKCGDVVSRLGLCHRLNWTSKYMTTFRITLILGLMLGETILRHVGRASRTKVVRKTYKWSTWPLIFSICDLRASIIRNSIVLYNDEVAFVHCSARWALWGRPSIWMCKNPWLHLPFLSLHRIIIVSSSDSIWQPARSSHDSYLYLGLNLLTRTSLVNLEHSATRPSRRTWQYPVGPSSSDCRWKCLQCVDAAWGRRPCRESHMHYMHIQRRLL